MSCVGGFSHGEIKGFDGNRSIECSQTFYLRFDLHGKEIYSVEISFLSPHYCAGFFYPLFRVYLSGMHRTQFNLLLILALTIALLLGAFLLPYPSVTERLSLGSAWLCLLLLVAAMGIGPLRRILTELAPINIYRRRDLGICAAALGLAHFCLGTHRSDESVAHAGNCACRFAAF